MAELVEASEQTKASRRRSLVTDKVSTVEEQRELFLWKFRDVDRAAVMVLYNQFKKADKHNRGELDEHEAMMLFEKRSSVKTAVELRDLIADMDSDKNHMLSFVEWCCAHFHKPFAELNNFVDEESRARAMEEAMRAGEEADKAAAAIEEAKQREELKASLRAAAIERENKLTGVEGMRAFFLRQVESAGDSTKTNEQTIKEEAARRRALREAKQKQNQAIMGATKTKSAREIAAEVKAETDRKLKEEDALKKKQIEDELKARADRKAALNAKWSGGGPIKP